MKFEIWGLMAAKAIASSQLGEDAHEISCDLNC